MSSETRRPSIIPSVLCSIALLGAMVCMLLPMLKVKTYAGETISLPGITILFGGVVEQELPSGVYSFSFNVNLYLLVLSQGFLLSAIACLLGRQSRFNRIFSISLAGASMIALLFARRFVCLASPITYEGLEYDFGFALSFILCLGALVWEVILLAVFDQRAANTAKNPKNDAEQQKS